MASMAASFMCCGVEKCGSPAPKSARSMPCDFIFRASAVIAMVAETSMRLIRSVRIFVGAATVAVLILQVSQIWPADRRCRFCGLWTPGLLGPWNGRAGDLFPLQPLHDDRGNERLDVAAELEDALDQARADVGVLLCGHHEQRLEP